MVVRRILGRIFPELRLFCFQFSLCYLGSVKPEKTQGNYRVLTSSKTSVLGQTCIYIPVLLDLGNLFSLQVPQSENQKNNRVYLKVLLLRLKKLMIG